MYSYTASSLVVILTITSVLINEIDSRNILCRQLMCGDRECEQIDKSSCPYGDYIDICGRVQCKSGPGQPCGGKNNAFGVCGVGMWCSDELCEGCSFQTVECYHFTGNKRP